MKIRTFGNPDLDDREAASLFRQNAALATRDAVDGMARTFGVPEDGLEMPTRAVLEDIVEGVASEGARARARGLEENALDVLEAGADDLLAQIRRAPDLAEGYAHQMTALVDRYEGGIDADALAAFRANMAVEMAEARVLGLAQAGRIEDANRAADGAGLGDVQAARLAQAVKAEALRAQQAREQARTKKRLALELAAQAGESTDAEIAEAEASGALSPVEARRLTQLAEERRVREARMGDLITAVEQALAGEGPAPDTTTAEGREAIDLYLQRVLMPALAEDDSAFRDAAVAWLAGRFGHVPDSVQRELLAQIQPGQPAAVRMAAVNRIAAIAKAGDGSLIEAFPRDVQAFVNTALQAGHQSDEERLAYADGKVEITSRPQVEEERATVVERSDLTMFEQAFGSFAQGTAEPVANYVQNGALNTTHRKLLYDAVFDLIDRGESWEDSEAFGMLLKNEAPLIPFMGFGGSAFKERQVREIISAYAEGDADERLEKRNDQIPRPDAEHDFAFQSFLFMLESTFEEGSPARAAADEYRALTSEAERNAFRDAIMGPDYVPTVFDEGTWRQGENIRAFMAETFPTDPALRDHFLLSVLPRAFGAMTTYAAIGLATRGAGLPALGGLAVTGLVGMSDARVGQFRDALASGASFEDALKAGDLAAVFGLAEAVPVMKIIDRVFGATGGGSAIRRMFVDAARSGSEEAMQEAFQAFVQNAIAQDIYDPERNLFEGVDEATAAGGISGASVFLALSAAFGGRRGSDIAPDQMQQNGTDQKPQVLLEVGGFDQDSGLIFNPDSGFSTANTPETSEAGRHSFDLDEIEAKTEISPDAAPIDGDAVKSAFRDWVGSSYDRYLANVDGSRHADQPLSDEARVAIWMWSTEAGDQSTFQAVNQQLRFPDDPSNRDMTPHIQMLDVALEELPAVEATLYRGVNDNHGFFAALDVGDEFTDHGFVATSRQKAVGLNREYLLVLTANSGRDISGKSMFPVEEEILLPRDTPFVIIQRIEPDDPNEPITLVMKEIDP